jgi:hypothetical protein
MSLILRRHWKAALAAILALAAGAIGIPYLMTDCEFCDAANTILLRGTVAQNCTVDVTTLGTASTLPLTATGAQRIQVGTVLQSCNKKTGYTLTVESQNCVTAPAGAKLVDSVSAESLAFSGEFANPTTGGSAASVTNLMSSTCTSQIGRDVTNAKVTAETSTIYVNFTGDATLAAGTYTDTLTITMNVK